MGRIRRRSLRRARGTGGGARGALPTARSGARPVPAAPRHCCSREPPLAMSTWVPAAPGMGRKRWRERRERQERQEGMKEQPPHLPAAAPQSPPGGGAAAAPPPPLRLRPATSGGATKVSGRRRGRRCGWSGRETVAPETGLSDTSAGAGACPAVPARPRGRRGAVVGSKKVALESLPACAGREAQGTVTRHRRSRHAVRGRGARWGV